MAIDLINLNKVNGYPSACAGAHVLNTTTDRVEVFQAKAVVIATGGASKVYLSIRAILTDRLATASRWRIEQAVASQTWNLTNSILPAYITPTRVLF